MHQSAAEAEAAEPSTSTQKKYKRSLGSFLKRITVPNTSSMQLEDSMEAELNGYLITPVIDGEQDPLAWWKLHRVNFPRLSELACKYLCIPAASSPSERLFSASGNIVT